MRRHTKAKTNTSKTQMAVSRISGDFCELRLTVAVAGAPDDVASSTGEALGACVMNEGAVGPAVPAEPVEPPDGINPTSWTMFGVSSLDGEGAEFVLRTTVGEG